MIHYCTPQHDSGIDCISRRIVVNCFHTLGVVARSRCSISQGFSKEARVTFRGSFRQSHARGVVILLDSAILRGDGHHPRTFKRNYCTCPSSPRLNTLSPLQQIRTRQHSPDRRGKMADHTSPFSRFQKDTTRGKWQCTDPVCRKKDWLGALASLRSSIPEVVSPC